MNEKGWLQNRNNQFWLLHIAGWTGWVILFALRGVTTSSAIGMSILLVDAAAGVIVTFPLRYLYRAIWDKSLVARIVTVIGASYLIAVIWQPIKNYAQFALDEHVTEFYPFNGLIGYSYYLILCWSGLYFGIKYYQMLQEEREKNLKASAMAHEAQLRMLRYQLNPHFLFNTLNAISTLILGENNETATSMVNRLSSFLRYSLDSDPLQKVELAQEINTMQLYLNIEKVRFEERLQVEFCVDDNAENALVPSLLLQPLIENAIKYAVADQEDGGKIKVTAQVFADELLLEICDSGPGIKMQDGELPAFKGVGITNTRERLQEIYANDHSCSFSTADPHGLHISIRIPYQTE
jgi:signal transduction histidine kinase|tara:strand:- start:5505 stop:6557 length:1053 start_codon:yes stop_codon:yes gene_type:complete